MGTVQKIVESLIRVSDDKKGQLSSRYSEHSAWMKSEFDVIRQLIKKNPRDNHKTNDENIPPVHAQVSNSSSNRSSSESNEEENAIRLKRKSPEMGVVGSRNSPDLKRNSTQDYEELATSAGLPTDLNRLKKEQLLEELESRGNVEFSMKSLKKDLVDALKDALLKCSKEAKNTEDCGDDYNNCLEAVSSGIDAHVTVMSNEENAVSVQETASLVPSNTPGNLGTDGKENTLPLSDKVESVKKTRNGSLMAEFRSLINNPAASQKLSIESDSDRASKIQNEYQARQQRHRQSQTGKIPKEIAVTDSAIGSVTADNNTLNVIESNQNDVCIPSVGAMDLVFSPLKPLNGDPNKCDGNSKSAKAPPASPGVASSMMELGSPILRVPSSPSPSIKGQSSAFLLIIFVTEFFRLFNYFIMNIYFSHILSPSLSSSIYFSVFHSLFLLLSLSLFLFLPLSLSLSLSHSLFLLLSLSLLLFLPLSLSLLLFFPLSLSLIPPCFSSYICVLNIFCIVFSFCNI